MPEPIIISFETEGLDGISETDKRVAALNERFGELKKRTGELKEDLSGVGEVESKGAGIANMAKKFIATGAAALVLQQAIKAVVQQYKAYLQDVEDSPELFSREQLANATALKDGVSDLDDAFRRIRISMLDVFAAGLADVANATADTINKSLDYRIALSNVADETKKVRLEMLQSQGIQLFDDEDITNAEEMMEALEGFIEVAESADQAMLNSAGGVNTFSSAIENMASTYSDLRDITRAVTRDTEAYNKKQDATMDKILNLRASIAKLITEGYGEQSEKVVALRDQIGELNNAMEENTENLERETNARIFKRAEELLEEQGMTEEQEKELLQRGVDMGLWTQEYVDQANVIIDKAREMFNEMLNPAPFPDIPLPDIPDIPRPEDPRPDRPDIPPDIPPRTPPDKPELERVPLGGGPTASPLSGGPTGGAKVSIFIENMYNTDDIEYLAQEVQRRLK